MGQCPRGDPWRPRHVLPALGGVWHLLVSTDTVRTDEPPLNPLSGFCSNLVFMNVGRNAWRIQLAAAFVPAVPLLLLIWFAPESPRWLMKKGNYPKAFRSFSRLRKAEIQAARDMVSPRLDTVFTWLTSQFYAHCQIEEEREAFKGTTYLSRFRDIFTVPRLRRANLASWVVMISQQLCGINIMCTSRM